MGSKDTRSKLIAEHAGKIRHALGELADAHDRYTAAARDAVNRINSSHQILQGAVASLPQTERAKLSGKLGASTKSVGQLATATHDIGSAAHDNMQRQVESGVQSLLQTFGLNPDVDGVNLDQGGDLSSPLPEESQPGSLSSLENLGAVGETTSRKSLNAWQLQKLLSNTQAQLNKNVEKEKSIRRFNRNAPISVISQFSSKR